MILGAFLHTREIFGFLKGRGSAGPAVRLPYLYIQRFSICTFLIAYVDLRSVFLSAMLWIFLRI